MSDGHAEFVVAFSAPDWESITRELARVEETAAVLLASRAREENRLTLLVREVVWAPEEAYELRAPEGLRISSRGYVGALKRAAEKQLVPIFLHTHPGGSSRPSRLDARVDEEIEGLFSLRSEQPHFARLIVGGTEDTPRISGLVTDTDSGTTGRVTKVRVAGGRLRIFLDEKDAEVAPEAFDRQLRAFGPGGQARLRALRVGVVGLGGTGSAVAEQLIRIGVGEIVAIDDDAVSATNLTRIHGSSATDIGVAKVDLAADEARDIGLGTHVVAVRDRITSREAARRLRGVDVIFGCTDDNAGRAVLSRLGYWYLIPVIDMGFVITGAAGEITGLFGRVTVVGPGQACLICRGRVDPALARIEVTPELERERLAAEGYAPGLAEPDPSVVAFTSLVGSLAVTELLERLVGYGEENPPSELILRLHDRQLNRNTKAPTKSHYCGDPSQWGQGDTEPFLGQVWV